MATRWKCQVVSGNKILNSFQTGEIVFAENRDDNLFILFNGKNGKSIPKVNMKDIALLSRRAKKGSSYVKLGYRCYHENYVLQTQSSKNHSYGDSISCGIKKQVSSRGIQK